MSFPAVPALSFVPARLLSCLALALAFLLSGFELPGQAGQGVTATAARIAGDDARTRFVADVSAPVGFTVYVLPSPYRVMIDLPEVSFDLPPGSGRKARGLVTEYRYGQVEAGRARIVLDAKGPVLIEKSFIVPPQAGQPARIVVDLVPTTEAKFAATMKQDELSAMAAIADAAGEGTDAPEAAPPAPEPEAAASPAAGDTATDAAEPAAQSPALEEPLAAPAVEDDPAAEAAAPEATDEPAAADPADEAAAAESANEPAPAAPALPLRKDGRRLVVIDPGHGGIDPGAIGLSKTKEKDVVLAFGLELKARLEAQGNIDVVMTRSSDEFLTLKKRVKIARDRAADLFIAIHADTVRGPEARGATIYTLSEKASDAEAEALAHKENRADIIGGVDLDTDNEEVTGILIDLVQRESKNHSMFFAKKAVNEMKSVTGFTGKPLRSAGFVVLKAPDVPSVLVELGYLSSKQDEKQLTSPKWRGSVAAAMARAVGKYFDQQVAQKTD